MADTRLEASLEMDIDQAIRALRQFRQQIGIEVPKAASQGAAGLGKFQKAAANATPTLVNFGRVVQDAPFGLVGIANNIDPLISSFQQLSVAAKQNGTSAFAELRKALVGPAGVALAVSTATSLLIVFGDEIAAAITKVTAFDKAQREAGTEGAKAFIKAQSEFNNYIDLIDNANISSARQQDILKKVNGELDNYGLAIKSVADLQRVGAEVGAIFADIKREEAKAQVLAAAAAEEYAKQVALGIKAQQGDAFGIFGDLRFDDKVKTLFGGLFAGIDLAEGFANSLSNSVDAQNKFNAASESSKAQIEVLRSALLKIPGVVEQFGNKQRQSTKDTIEATAALKDFNANAKLVTPLPREAVQPLNDFPQTLEELERANGIITDLGQTAFGQYLQPAIQKSAESTALIVAGFSAVNPLIDQTFNALANGENVFDSLKQGVKRLIVDLIKAVALAAILSALPGGAAGATGLTAVIGKLLNFKGFRAGGGPVQSGGSYIVGEKGPELFVPQNGGRIIPNSSLMNGGGPMGGVLTARVEGSDLLFILERAQRSAGRRR